MENINSSDFRKFVMSHNYNGSYMSGSTFDDMMRKSALSMSYQPTQIIETSPSFGVSIDIFSRMLQDRIIYIGSTIDENVGNVVTCQLLYLNSVSNSSKISIYLNSGGGSVVDGWSIIDSIFYAEAPIATCVTGMAASMAAVILTAGDKDMRYAQGHSRIMVHPASSGFYGKVADAEVSFNELKRTNDELFEFLAKRTRHSVEEVKEVCKATDKWYTPSEAKEFGIIDNILLPKKAIEL